MTELKIDRDERIRLRAESHDLNPTVLLGQNGLTEAVVKEIEKALNSHGLVKIRIPGDDRDERAEIIQKILDDTSSARIQTIGKTVTIWRPMPKEEEPIQETLAKAGKTGKDAKPRSRGGKILATDKKRIAKAKAKTPMHRAHPKRKRTVKKAMGSKA